MRKLTILLLLVCQYVHGQTSVQKQLNDYQKAWAALDKNDFTASKELLLKAAKDPKYYNDAVSTLIMLDSYLGRERHAIINYDNPLTRIKDPQAYFYAMWFNAACLGVYGKMDSAHLANEHFIMTHPDLFNGSMQAAAHYFKSRDYLSRRQFTKSFEEAAKIGAIDTWQYTGPFDNIAGSGFNKNYAPISHPEQEASFKAYNNIPVTWFVPGHIEKHSYVFVETPFPKTSGLIYAQCFIRADEDKTCILALGCSGSLKAWVNDKLLFSVSEERPTELDTYKVPCHLKKGYNRVLVQVGSADTETPNFIARFIDNDYSPIPGLQADSKYHPYPKDTSAEPSREIPLFAETFFEQKIAKNPDDPINYILLTMTYLRNQKYYQAQKVMAKILPTHKDNILLLIQYMLSLHSKADNTDASECFEKIKTLDPKGYLSLIGSIDEQIKDKKYKEAMGILDQVEAGTGSFEQLLLLKIQVLAKQDDLNGMLTLIKKGCQEFPDNPTFALLLYNYDKKVSNNSEDALKVLQDYNNRLFNYSIVTQLATENITEGQFEKGIDLLKGLLVPLPAQDEVYNSIAGQYFGRNQLDSAIAYLTILSSNGPYKSQPYVDLATCYLQKGDTVDAVKFMHKALDCNPALSDIRTKMRGLTGKSDLYGYFPQVDEDKLITGNLNSPFDTTHHYYYIFDLHNTLIYSQGSNEQEARTAVYINDDKGIDKFNTLYIPYNENFQELTILKAEVIKKNGSRIPADINNNEIVYPKLARGDVIYYHYKLASNGIGRLGREFWDKFYFSASVPTYLAQYNILVDKQIPLYYHFSNERSVDPVTSTHENFKLYCWKMEKIPALKDEPLMPLRWI